MELATSYIYEPHSSLFGGSTIDVDLCDGEACGKVRRYLRSVFCNIWCFHFNVLYGIFCC